MRGTLTHFDITCFLSFNTKEKRRKLKLQHAPWTIHRNSNINPCLHNDLGEAQRTENPRCGTVDVELLRVQWVFTWAWLNSTPSQKLPLYIAKLAKAL